MGRDTQCELTTREARKQRVQARVPRAWAEAASTRYSRSGSARLRGGGGGGSPAASDSASSRNRRSSARTPTMVWPDTMPLRCSARCAWYLFCGARHAAAPASCSADSGAALPDSARPPAAPRTGGEGGCRRGRAAHRELDVHPVDLVLAAAAKGQDLAAARKLAHHRGRVLRQEAEHRHEALVLRRSARADSLLRPDSLAQRAPTARSRRRRDSSAARACGTAGPACPAPGAAAALPRPRAGPLGAPHQRVRTLRLPRRLQRGRALGHGAGVLLQQAVLRRRRHRRILAAAGRREAAPPRRGALPVAGRPPIPAIGPRGRPRGAPVRRAARPIACAAAWWLGTGRGAVAAAAQSGRRSHRCAV